MQDLARVKIGSVLLSLTWTGFKTIDDSFGHAAGDEVWRLSQLRLPCCMRSNAHVHVSCSECLPGSNAFGGSRGLSSNHEL
ncbi:MAG: diguanylate cyclase [Pseudonocardiaceae bacterium]|nr:diguanylate cyclase [Afipia sp.]RTL65026.1 MAG: diguanylate cyclase [Pseudonocardiaceae bacterium]